MNDQKTVNGVRYILRSTRSGDTLAKLMQAYGVSLRDILTANDIVFAGNGAYVTRRMMELNIPRSEFSFGDQRIIVRENDINEWVADIGGRCQPGPPVRGSRGTPIKGCPNGSFATFTDQTTIFLPDRPRRNGAVSRPTPPPPQAAQMRVAGLPLWTWAGVGVVGFFAVRKARRKKKGK